MRLDFRAHDDLDHADQAVRSDLSTVATQGRCLWIANDEFASVERLVRQDDGGYSGHEVVYLGELFDLPEGEDGEMDIEGLDVDGGYLWVVGSHSLTREKPKPDEHDPDDALARLTEVEEHPNRHFLGCIPLLEKAHEDGVFETRAKAEDAAGKRGLACLKMKGGSNALSTALAEDVHISRFMAVPAKENGFDVEGIAVRGNRLFLGLRGPVLRGWAMLIELEVKQPRKGRLKLRKIGKGGARYRKHFLDLGGLGIRELAFQGDALLILAGPTMDLDGPVVLYRWADPLADEAHTVITADRLEQVMQLPYGRGEDHAEAICLVPAESGRKEELLVLYDLPAPSRLHAKTAIDGDIFSITAPRRRRRAR